MARLRNRIVKAEFWTDGELLRWPRDKRETYRGLWALAEDSGCIEDDPFTWKLTLWPSPVDADITVDLITTWRDELIAVGKLRPYTADGKQYLYLTRFHQHEHPRNPQHFDLPLPPWVVWEPNASDPRKGQYRESGDVVATLYKDLTSVPVLPSPAQPCPVQSCPKEEEDHPGLSELVALAITEVPKSESTEDDYRRTIKRYRPKFSDEHLERIIVQLGNYRPTKPRPKLHLTLANWLSKEPRDPLPASHAPFEPKDTSKDVPMPEEYRGMFGHDPTFGIVPIGIGKEMP